MRNFSTHNMQKTACENSEYFLRKTQKNSFGHVAENLLTIELTIV